MRSCEDLAQSSSDTDQEILVLSVDILLFLFLVSFCLVGSNVICELVRSLQTCASQWASAILYLRFTGGSAAFRRKKKKIRICFTCRSRQWPLMMPKGCNEKRSELSHHLFISFCSLDLPPPLTLNSPACTTAVSSLLIVLFLWFIWCETWFLCRNVRSPPGLVDLVTVIQWAYGW